MPPLTDGRGRGRDDLPAERRIHFPAALDLPSPPSIAVDTERHPGLVRWRDPAGEADHSSGRPLKSGGDRPQVASQERDRRGHEVRIHLTRQPASDAPGTASTTRRGRVIQERNEVFHEAALVRHVGLHLREFRAAGRLDALDPGLVLDPESRRPTKSTAIARDRTIDLQQLQRLLDPADPEIDGLLELRLGHRIDRLEGRQDLVHVHRRRKSRIHEVRSDGVVLAPTQKHAEGMIDGTTSAADLLVVRDRGAGPLVVDDESEIRLVEAHPQCHRRDKGLHIAGDEGVFERFALLGGEVGVVRAGIDPLAPQERGDALGVRHREAVDDAAAGELRKLAREPGESFGLVVQRDRIESERIAAKGSTKDLDPGAELIDDVGDDPIIGGGGRGQDRDARGQKSKDPRDAPVVGAEVVTPVGDAVRLVHYQQADRALDAGQDVGREALVRETLRGDEEDVDGVGCQTVLDRVPFVDVARVDRRRAEAQPFRHGDLVPHEG